MVKKDAPVVKQVKVFVDDMTVDETIRSKYDEGTNWGALESTHGEQVTELLQRENSTN